ncbi:unnamed protein product [Cyprideis torosa]|uniref:Uncharacterized protein n=1 Tax=Cyprideis torosa TaxID=163714 RepID=A0A7R8ZPC9_9CRUS|nr:unnamed protein product [Cyprideis torosa]CAG0893681.1 unnamed protein product [Cyprideis torosa]
MHLVLDVTAEDSGEKSRLHQSWGTRPLLFFPTPPIIPFPITENRTIHNHITKESGNSYAITKESGNSYAITKESGNSYAITKENNGNSYAITKESGNSYAITKESGNSYAITKESGNSYAITKENGNSYANAITKESGNSYAITKENNGNSWGLLEKGKDICRVFEKLPPEEEGRGAGALMRWERCGPPVMCLKHGMQQGLRSSLPLLLFYNSNPLDLAAPGIEPYTTEGAILHYAPSPREALEHGSFSIFVQGFTCLFHIPNSLPESHTEIELLGSEQQRGCWPYGLD